MKKPVVLTLTISIIVTVSLFVLGISYGIRVPFAAVKTSSDAPGTAEAGEVLTHPFFGRHRPYRSDLETAIRLSKETQEIVITDKGQIWNGMRECEPCKIVRVRINQNLKREQIIYLIIQELNKQ